MCSEDVHTQQLSLCYIENCKYLDTSTLSSLLIHVHLSRSPIQLVFKVTALITNTRQRVTVLVCHTWMIDSCCCTLIFHSRVCQKMICTVSLQRDQGTLDFPCLSFIYFLSSRMLPAPWRGIGVGYIYPRLTLQKAQQWDKASEQRSCGRKKNDMFVRRCIEYPQRCPVQLQVLFVPTLLCNVGFISQRNTNRSVCHHNDMKYKFAYV